MSAGVPVIGPAYAMEIRRILDAERCGRSVNCEDPQAVAGAIIHLGENPAEAREMGRRAREAFLQRHN